MERYTQGVKRFDFDRGLAPYDLGSYTRWQQLSSYITPAAIAALQPTSGNINILAEADPGDAAPATAAEAALQQQLQAGREAAAARQAAGQRSAAPVQGTAGADGGSSGKEEAMQCDQQQQGQQQQQQQEKQQQPQPAPPPPEQAAPHAGRCFYTPLPRLVKRGGLSPAELTALNLDKSRVLEEVLVQKFNGSEDAFLGEGPVGWVGLGEWLVWVVGWVRRSCLNLALHVLGCGGRHLPRFEKMISRSARGTG